MSMWMYARHPAQVLADFAQLRANLCKQSRHSSSAQYLLFVSRTCRLFEPPSRPCIGGLCACCYICGACYAACEMAETVEIARAPHIVLSLTLTAEGQYLSCFGSKRLVAQSLSVRQVSSSSVMHRGDAVPHKLKCMLEAGPSKKAAD
jgi:hypothetical protein